MKKIFLTILSAILPLAIQAQGTGAASSTPQEAQSPALSQTATMPTVSGKPISPTIEIDTISILNGKNRNEAASIDSLSSTSLVTTKEIAQSTTPKNKKWKWTPNTKRALWLGLAIPGAGQIYNRKFWKLPIIYGGMVGCVYAWRWNDMMYADYSRAYIDLMDDDPTTESYNKFMHLGVKITDANKKQYEDIFKNRKDTYRRWRDLSIFILIGVYALSVIDAYVDASLSEFDISRDLSIRIEPAVIKTNTMMNSSRLFDSGVGVQCQLSF